MWSLHGQKGDGFGTALAGLGDLDGDGLPDWAVGTPSGAAAQGSPGGYVEIRSGASGSILLRLEGHLGRGRFGAALAALPDLDRDGLPDLLVGAPLANGDAPVSGTATAYSSRTGMPLRQLTGKIPYGDFGRALAGIGDLNGDGVGDFLVGAPGESANGRNSGSVFVYSGADGYLLYRLVGQSPDLRFGAALAALGDLDQDRVPDFAVGAPGAGKDSAGQVVLYSGKDGHVLRVFPGPIPHGNFGFALAALGDLDGDGRTELGIGAPAADAGLARIVSGDGKTLYELRGTNLGSRFGAALSAVGDVDHDGHDDFALGAPLADGAGAESGVVRLYSGRDGSLIREYAGTPGDRYGSALSPLDPSLRTLGFVAGGEARDGRGYARFYRWSRPRAVPVAGAAPAAADSGTAMVPLENGSPSYDDSADRWSFTLWVGAGLPWWWTPISPWGYSWWSSWGWWGPGYGFYYGPYYDPFFDPYSGPYGWYWWWPGCWDDDGDGDGDDGGSGGGTGGSGGGATGPPSGPILAHAVPVGGSSSNGSGAGSRTVPTGAVGLRSTPVLASAGLGGTAGPKGSSGGGGAAHLGQGGLGGDTILGPPISGLRPRPTAPPAAGRPSGARPAPTSGGNLGGRTAPMPGQRPLPAHATNRPRPRSSLLPPSRPSAHSSARPTTRPAARPSPPRPTARPPAPRPRPSVRPPRPTPRPRPSVRPRGVQLP